MKALLLIFCFVLPSFGANQADFLMKGQWGAGHLLQWELSRLESLGLDVKLPFAEDSDLGKRVLEKTEDKTKGVTLKDLYKFFESKPTLSTADRQELLGVLRLANTVNRIDLEDSKSAYRTLIQNELKKIDPARPVVIQLPKEVEEKIIREAKDKLELNLESGKITSNDLRKVLDSPKIKKDLFKEKELASLLGNVREKSAAERGQEFISDVAEDRALDKLFVEVGKPSQSGRLPRDTNLQTFFPRTIPSNQGGGQPVEPPRITVQPPKNLGPTDRGFHAPSRDLPEVDMGRIGRGGPISGPAINTPPFSALGGGGGQGQGDGGIILDQQRIGDGVGQIRNPKVVEKQNAGKFSLIMHMSFQGAGSARCQTTIVKKEPVGDKCTYNAATARHCVVDEERPSARLSALSIQGLGELSNADIKVDPNGNDFALITFTMACAEVPVVPLRKDRVQDGEEILVETVPGSTMVGRAKDAVSGDSLMTLDVRSPLNQPFGINPGDSGGGVATVGPNGNVELVGVISSKPVDPRLAGIGFFAAKSSMDWANEELSRPLVARNQARPIDQPGH